MKAVYQTVHRRIMFFPASMLFALTLLTGCTNQPLSDSLSRQDTFITDEITDVISAESHDLYEENSESTGDEITVIGESAVVEKEVSTEMVSIENYYGFYQVTEFLPSRSWMKGYRYDGLTEQEADMLLGRVVELNADRIVTYDSLRRLGSRDGRMAFPGNYIIEEIVIEKPRYSWDFPNTDTILSEYSYVSSIIDVDMIEGKIGIQVTSPWGEHNYYVMPDGILMFSTLSAQYYYLEKLAEKPKQEPKRVLSEEEKNEILLKLFGIYTITEFLPTKFFPALDSSGNPYLPKEEADKMIGREVTISEDIYVSYDNFRLPNSGIMNRAMDDFWLEQIEIPSPYYLVEEKGRKELYGLKDDEMLRKELLQDRYVEINVFPGYSVNGFDCLPQLYLLNDGRIIMYSMGDFFLLEKVID